MERHALKDATDWFVRLQDRKVSSGTREKFTEWLLHSPDHVAAYIAVAETYARHSFGADSAPCVDTLVAEAKAESDSSNVVALATGRHEAGADGEEKTPNRRMVWGWRFAVAAAIVAATLLLGWVGWITLAASEHHHFTTQIGEQRSVPLEDGSLVYLNTDSELSVVLSGKERRVSLTKGEARFTVAKDPTRPFIVSTRHATVRALGTIFNVQTGGERTAVSVIEGRIVVTGQAETMESAAAQPSSGSDPTRAQVTLSTGQQVAVTRTGEILRGAGPPLERVMAWPNGHLVFRDEPLLDLVSDFNRYHRQPLRIIDPELAVHRVNGTFDAYDRTSLIQFLERYENVRIETAPDGSQLLFRAGPSQSDPH